MKKIIYILLFISFSFNSEIKNKTIEVINEFYDTKVEITEHTFKIPSKVKKSIQCKLESSSSNS